MNYLHVRGTNGPLQGTIRVPPSKYHAHRALIMGSLAAGATRVIGHSNARHVQYTIRALRALGTRIDVTPEGYVVHGGRYDPRKADVPFGSSGSTAYFMVGLGCLSEHGPVTFDAEMQLRNRPIAELLESLRLLGIRVEASNNRLPVTVYPGLPKGGRIEINGMLSQWVSGLLLVAPFATHDTTIQIVGEFNERHYVELTVRMMREFGIEIEQSPDERTWMVRHGQSYTAPERLVLSSDVSSAAYGLVAAAIHPSDVLFTATSSCEDHPERELFNTLARMGAPLNFKDHVRELHVVTAGRRLRGTRIDCTDFPDALPALCVAAALAKGRTVLENVAHARRKESDRVRASMQLVQMGARMTATENRIEIEGVDRLRATALSSFNDHRVLMSLAVAGTRTNGLTTLTFPNAYRISYPDFLDDMNRLGLDMRIERAERAYRLREVVNA
ncbi:MAG: 3-phosphoshikimate 1-carboxyvinyltransferase [Rhodanobacteraceae bacterium]